MIAIDRFFSFPKHLNWYYGSQTALITMAETWLGIDPGLAIIGWAILVGDDRFQPQLIDYGIIETKKQLSTPQRLVEIERDMVSSH
jgi:hypothetical protein